MPPGVRGLQYGAMLPNEKPEDGVFGVVLFERSCRPLL
jgi:hypothetical protein